MIKPAAVDVIVDPGPPGDGLMFRARLHLQTAFSVSGLMSVDDSYADHRKGVIEELYREVYGDIQDELGELQKAVRALPDNGFMRQVDCRITSIIDSMDPDVEKILCRD